MRRIVFLLCICLSAAALANPPDKLPAWASSGNPSNDKLMVMKENEQAAMLSKATGYSCLGKKPFYDGTLKRGSNKGVSFWSITCDNTGKRYMVAIAPDTIGSTKVFSCSLYRRGPIQCYEVFDGNKLH